MGRWRSLNLFVGLSILLAINAAPAFAQMTNAETIATLGGRILGTAKACGFDGSRVARTGERVLKVVNIRSKSDRERGSATALFASAYNSGVDEVGSGRTTCRQARTAFEDIENKFSRY